MFILLPLFFFSSSSPTPIEHHHFGSTLSPVLDPIVPSTNPKDSRLSLRFLCGVIQGIEIWNLGFGISGKLNLEAKRNGVLIGVGDEEEKTEGEE